MLDLSYTIRRGKHQISFIVQHRFYGSGLYIELDKPLIDRHGREYIWSASKDLAKNFREAISLLKSGGNKFRVRQYGVSAFDEVAQMEVEISPSVHEWIILSITHWGTHGTDRFFEGSEPNLVWIMKLRMSELEHIADSLDFFFSGFHKKTVL